VAAVEIYGSGNCLGRGLEAVVAVENYGDGGNCLGCDFGRRWWQKIFDSSNLVLRFCVAKLGIRRVALIPYS
jgi:hypothetical protein